MKKEELSSKLGEKFLEFLLELDKTTAWLDYDDEAIAILEAGKRMVQELSDKEYELKESQKVVTMLQMQAPEDALGCEDKGDLGCEDEDALGCEELRKHYMAAKRKRNAKLSAEIRKIKDAIEGVKLMLQCKRYKQLYETTHLSLCIHKQHRDDHQGMHQYGTCNKTGEIIWAKDVPGCNHRKPHEVDGGKYTILEVIRKEVQSEAEPSWSSFLAFKPTDPDAAYQSMTTEVKGALGVISAALDSTDNKSTNE